MNILGVSEGFHDAGICLLRDDKIHFASHSERHSQKKGDKWIHPTQLPKSKLNKPDVIAYYEKLFRKNLRRLYAGQKWQKPRRNTMYILVTMSLMLQLVTTLPHLMNVMS